MSIVNRISQAIHSSAFWTVLAGVAGSVCGSLGLGQISHQLSQEILGLGALLVLIPSWHVTKAGQAQRTANAQVINRKSTNRSPTGAGQP